MVVGGPPPEEVAAREKRQQDVRNIPTVHVLTYDQLNAYDVLVSDDIVFSQAALEGFIAAKTKKEEVNA